MGVDVCGGKEFWKRCFSLEWKSEGVMDDDSGNDEEDECEEDMIKTRLMYWNRKFVPDICLLAKFVGGLQSLHKSEDNSYNWLETQHLWNDN